MVIYSKYDRYAVKKSLFKWVYYLEVLNEQMRQISGGEHININKSKLWMIMTINMIYTRAFHTGRYHPLLILTLGKGGFHNLEGFCGIKKSPWNPNQGWMY